MMHSNEIKIEADLVRELLKVQFPKWADLPLSPITPSGTDNAMFKLGDALAVRLPRTEHAAQNIEKECRWLPKLAPHLPLPIPAPVAQGKPHEKYPLPWAICHLLVGENLNVSHLDDLHQAAIDMGEFVSALQQIDVASGPINKRGLPLNTRDEETRAAITQLEGVIDVDRAASAWESMLALPQWNGLPTWLHGDLHPGNLLVKAGRISAVIDFGSCGVGDPAADLMFAWAVLDTKSREVFRSIVKPDEASWARGRGWAFTMGIVAYPYYQESNPVFAAVAKRAMDEALADC
ncbi:MAG TPA: aminoglycoside phosphotransferase family protein [Patescibacteria group bacterium]|nr:aminoglycoside phosphotransferase family protein [Patescibacteria group bacterium]